MSSVPDDENAATQTLNCSGPFEVLQLSHFKVYEPLEIKRYVPGELALSPLAGCVCLLCVCVYSGSLKNQPSSGDSHIAIAAQLYSPFVSGTAVYCCSLRDAVVRLVERWYSGMDETSFVGRVLCITTKTPQTEESDIWPFV